MPVIDLSACYVEIPESDQALDPCVQTRLLIQRLQNGEAIHDKEIESIIGIIVGKHRAAMEAKAAGVRKPRTPKPVDSSATEKPVRRTRAKTDTLDPVTDF